MAVTVNTLWANGDAWILHGYSAVASTGEILLAAAAGKSHYIQAVTVMLYSMVGDFVRIGEGIATLAVETVWIGPLRWSATNGSAQGLILPVPIQLTANKALTFGVEGSSEISIVIKGFTR